MLKFCGGALIFVFFSCVCLAITANLAAHNRTDVSLFMREAPDQALTECFSESGDLYRQLGHHGPAIENPYYALRLYFNHNGGMDLYSKNRTGLELKATRWYPSSAQQRAGFGGDFYHVGDTVGLGGIRLWDGDAVRRLDPVTARHGRVVSEGSTSSMEICSEGFLTEASESTLWFASPFFPIVVWRGSMYFRPWVRQYNLSQVSIIVMAKS